MQAATRRYSFELGSSIIVYSVLLITTILLLKQGRPQQPWGSLVALLPMLGAAGVAWATVRQIGRIDEMQRRVQLEALAIAFAGTAFVTFSYGFLENVGYPRLSMFFVWPLMATLWIAAIALCRRRFA